MCIKRVVEKITRYVGGGKKLRWGVPLKEVNTNFGEKGDEVVEQGGNV